MKHFLISFCTFHFRSTKRYTKATSKGTKLDIPGSNSSIGKCYIEYNGVQISFVATVRIYIYQSVSNYRFVFGVLK